MAEITITPDTSTDIIPLQDHQVGTQTSSPTKIPQGVNFYMIKTPRNNWPDMGPQTIKVRTEISFDGGQTWTLLDGFTAHGGNITSPILDKNGERTPLTETFSTMRIPQPENPNRMIRIKMTNQAVLNTKAEVTVKQI